MIIINFILMFYGNFEISKFQNTNIIKENIFYESKKLYSKFETIKNSDKLQLGSINFINKSSFILYYGYEIFFHQYKTYAISNTIKAINLLKLKNFLEKSIIDYDMQISNLNIKPTFTIINENIIILNTNKGNFKKKKYTSSLNHKYLLWPIKNIENIETIKKQGNTILKLISNINNFEIYSPDNGFIFNINFLGNNINYIFIINKYGEIIKLSNIENPFFEGFFVNRGDIIGINKSSNFINIEIFKNSKIVDPINHFNLSTYFKGNLFILLSYPIKYIDDILEYKYHSKLRVIGENEFERRKTFLKKFGFGEYKNLEIWEQAGKYFDIDIDLIICIGYAETGIGKNFAKDGNYNIGNVGNNDRGDRKSYNSAIEGIRGIYFALNNEYLKDYKTLNQLSRFGNNDGFIYASSSKNWQKNVIKCLNAIKGFRVSDDYPFRIFSKK